MESGGGIAEENRTLVLLREKLHKKVDLLDAAQLSQNPTLAQEILRDGVKIYG